MLNFLISILTFPLRVIATVGDSLGIVFTLGLALSFGAWVYFRR